MTTERIQIEIHSNGAKVVQGDVRGIAKELDLAQLAAHTLGDALEKSAAAAKRLASKQNFQDGLAAQMAKLRTEFDAFEASVDPVVDKQQKLAQAQNLVTRAMAAGIVPIDRGNQLLDEYAKELDRAAKAASRAKTQTGGLSAGFGQFRSALAGLGISIGIREIARLGDSFTQLKNRIAAVTGGSEEAARALKGTFEVANATGTSVEDTGQAFQRLSISLKTMGIRAESTLGIVKTLQQAFFLSGAGADEATAAMIQLSQGLSRGELRGEEFNSIVEQGGLIQDLLAKRLGVTRGELRGLAEDGKITSTVIVQALTNGAEEMEQKFGESTSTIAQGLARLKNAFVETAGAVEQRTHVFEGAGKVLNFLGGSLEDAKKEQDGFTKSLEIGARVAAQATTSFQAMNVELFKIVQSDATKFLDGINKNVLAVAESSKKMDALSASVDKTIDKSQKLAGVRKDLTDAVRLGTIDDAEAARVFGLYKKSLDDVGEGGKKAKKDLETLRNQIDQLERSLSPTVAAERELTDVVLLLDEAQKKLNLSDEEATRLANLKADSLRAQLDPYATTIELLEQELQLLDLGKSARERAIKVREFENQFKAAGLELTEAEIAKLQELTLAIENKKNAEKEIDEIRKRIETNEKKAQDDAIKRSTEEGKRVADEAKKRAEAMRKLSEQVDLTAFGARVLADSLSGVADTLGDFLIDGKADFRGFAESLLKDITKLLIKLALLKAAMAALGPSGAATGFGGALLQGLSGFATGGSFRVGGSGGPDSQLVAFRASPNETVSIETPQQKSMRESDGGGVNVPIRVVNVLEPSLVTSAMQSSQGEQVVLNHIGKNPTQIRRLLGIG